MTVKEAISHLDNWRNYNDEDVCNVAIDALEKQIPEKPHRNYEHCSVQWCNCGWCLGRKEEGRVYCSRCGQAIDWSESK